MFGPAVAVGVRYVGRVLFFGPAVWYALGAAAVLVAITLAMVAAGGSPMALVDNYRSAMTVMAGISMF